MKLVESPSVLIRAKAVLVVLEIIKQSPEMILTCCQARYITYSQVNEIHTVHKKKLYINLW